jgi:SAM-dependent methyltransferase
MNLLHRWLCGSAHWRHALEREILPWVLGDVSFGAELLELGPGPGLTTKLLHTRTLHLTAVEIDSGLCHRVGGRLRGTNVRIVQGDATAIPFADSTFTSAVAFTMLHHLSRSALQDRLFREVHRVLRHGGVFVGTDALDGWTIRLLHIADTFTPINPAMLPVRLEKAGFGDVDIEVKPGRFRFRASAHK